MGCKKHLELDGQLTMTGGAFEEMKQYAERYRRYEAEKDYLKATCNSFEEYECKVRELAKLLQV